MNGLHFFIALTEVDREMRRSVSATGPHGVIDPEEYRQQASRLQRLFRPERAPVTGIESPQQLPARPPQAA